MSNDLKPPFRADHVGSLLRPAALVEARDRRRTGDITADQLREAEDAAIRDAVALQESVGLQSVTDGEFRRDYWHLDFLCGFEGIQENDEKYSMAFSGGGGVATALTTGAIGPHNGFMRDHFTFLNETTDRTAKFCIPGPAMAHLRGGRGGISADAYPDLAEFWADLTAAYRDEVASLAALGCRYLQIDDTSIAYLCDEDFRRTVRERGDDPDALVETYARAATEAVAGRPADMFVTTHMCRGNFQSTWMMRGGYESVAERMFAHLDFDAYFMEYDSDRAGGFEPLRFVPRDKTVVLGLVTSKTPGLEPKDEIKRRIDEATKYVDLGRLCLSPQCGFASTHHGNDLTEDEQRRKLELVVEIAEEVWDGA